jgi:hypothetical protein
MYHPRYRLWAITCLLLTCLFVGACKRDPCKRLECENGECVDGVCVCQEGFGGDLCERKLNAIYDGEYKVEETCLAGDDDYTVYLSPKAGTADSVIATGLWGKSWAVTLGTIQASGDLYCPRKRFGSMEISLQGGVDEISNNILNVTYKLYYVGHASHFDQCTATFTRQ